MGFSVFVADAYTIGNDLTITAFLSHPDIFNDLYRLPLRARQVIVP